MIDNPSYDRVLADQQDNTKLPKFQLYQINRGDFIGIYIRCQTPKYENGF